MDSDQVQLEPHGLGLEEVEVDGGTLDPATC